MGRTGAAEALRIEGLRKSFGPHEVLRGVDLAVAAHEVICLIAASGSGKSTLLRCVNLLERIDAGTIWLDGQVITRSGVDENRVRRHIGIVFQSFNLFPHMTVERNVTLAPMKGSYSASVRVLCLFAGLTWLAVATRQLGSLTGGPGW